MEVKFYKMNGIGNDFILFNDINNNISKKYNLNELAKRLCNRNFSIGADGVVIVTNSDIADIKYRIFNADGSEAEMCGNGIRCFTHFIHLEIFKNKNSFNIETNSGIIYTKIINKLSKFDYLIEAKIKDNTILSKPFKINSNLIDNKNLIIHPIIFGPPHAIIFCENLENINIPKIGKHVENLEYFKNKTNVDFVEITNKSTINLRVWERGVGETLACGTGACASTIISNTNSLTNAKVNVHLKGGILKINIKGNYVTMVGNSKISFIGKIKI